MLRLFLPARAPSVMQRTFLVSSPCPARTCGFDRPVFPPRLVGVRCAARPNRHTGRAPLARTSGLAWASPALGAASHLNTDRRANEAEFLPQLIDQEALVGKMQRGRYVFRCD